MKKRTKLADRTMPNYTRGEEVFNMVSHIVGAALGIVALVLCIFFAVKNGHGPLAVVSVIIYGVALIILYTMSSVYHGLRLNMGKRVMRVIDHCTIYFLIAGTYTPILLIAMLPKFPVETWIIFGIEWGCAAIAATLTAIDLKKYDKLSLACYIIMGWIIIFFINKTYEAVGTGGIVFLLLGGVAYTIGSILYVIGRKKKWMHSVFHLFILAGSILQFFAIIFFVLN